MMGKEKPNIILIIMDAGRAQNFSCYGYKRETTPFLDKLAREGRKYEKCVAQGRYSLPSHGSLFSGEYPHKLNLSNKKEVFQDNKNIAEKLSGEGTKLFQSQATPSYLLI